MIALVIFVFYAVEAWSRKTPWIFTDELEWTQISRSIAATGHAARRGEPIYFKSLYAYLIAPVWWIHSTSAAYSAIKYAERVRHAARRDPDLPARANARDQARRRASSPSARSRCPRWPTSPRSSPRSSPTPTSRSAPGSRCERSRSGRRRDVDHRRRLPRSAATSSGSAQFTTLPVAFVDRGGRPLVHRAARQGRSAATGRRATSSARSRSRSASRCLFNRVVLAAHPGVAGPDAVLQEPHGRPRPPRRASRSRSASASCR